MSLSTIVNHQISLSSGSNIIIALWSIIHILTAAAETPANAAASALTPVSDVDAVSSYKTCGDVEGVVDGFGKTSNSSATKKYVPLIEPRSDFSLTSVSKVFIFSSITADVMLEKFTPSGHFAKILNTRYREVLFETD